MVKPTTHIQARALTKCEVHGIGITSDYCQRITLSVCPPQKIFAPNKRVKDVAAADSTKSKRMQSNDKTMRPRRRRRAGLTADIKHATAAAKK